MLRLTQLALVVASVAPLPPPRVSAAAAADGESAVALRSRYTAMSPCFVSTYAALDCTAPHSDADRSLAMALANCHLAHAGRPTHVCSNTGAAAFAACMESAPAEVYATFTTFTLHVSALCFNAQASTWQATVAAAAERLAAGQVALLEEHARALSDAASIADTLGHIAGVVSAVGSVQGIFLRNLYALQTAAFYAVSAGATLTASSAHRTARARAPLVLGLIVAAALELALVAQQGHSFGGARLVNGARGGWVIAAVAAIVAACAAVTARALFAAARAILPSAALDAVLAACYTAEPLVSSFAAAWGASDIDAFRLSQARWAVRWAYLAAAAGVLVYTAVAFVDYGAASHAMLCELLGRLGPQRERATWGELEDAQSPPGLQRTLRARAQALWRSCCVRNGGADRDSVSEDAASDASSARLLRRPRAGSTHRAVLTVDASLLRVRPPATWDDADSDDSAWEPQRPAAAPAQSAPAGGAAVAPAPTPPRYAFRARSGSGGGIGGGGGSGGICAIESPDAFALLLRLQGAADREARRLACDCDSEGSGSSRSSSREAEGAAAAEDTEGLGWADDWDTSGSE